jgi:hypothetical protein
MGEGDWTNVIIPGDMANPGFTHLRNYLISGNLIEKLSCNNYLAVLRQSNLIYQMQNL